MVKNIIDELQEKLEGLTLVKEDDNIHLELPFKDNMGDPIEFLVLIDEGAFVLTDMGHTAGLLFSLGQHGENTPGHLLIKNLTDAYAIKMDYNEGTLWKRFTIPFEDNTVFDYLKVVASIQITLPALRLYKRERKARARLAVRLLKDISQLQLPVNIERQAEITGRNMTWLVESKYELRHDSKRTEVILVTADLNTKEPQLKAEHVVALAVDTMPLNGNRDLRVIYEPGSNGNRQASDRAVAMIVNNQTQLKYRAIDYSNIDQKQLFLANMFKDFAPLM